MTANPLRFRCFREALACYHEPRPLVHIHGTLNVLEPASPQLSIARSKLLILCPMVSIVWRTKFLCPEGRIGGLPAAGAFHVMHVIRPLEGADTSLATAGHAHLRLRLTCYCRDRKLTCDCRVCYNVKAWGGNLNASGGHCGEGCRVGGQHERSHLPRGNALGQRGGEQQRQTQAMATTQHTLRV